MTYNWNKTADYTKAELRHEAAKLLRANGWPFSEIGRLWDVSRQRGEQLVKTEPKGRRDYRIDYNLEESRILSEMPEPLVREITALKLSSTRLGPIIQRKKRVVRVMRNVYKLSYPMIGFMLNRNHASIINLYKSKKQ